ncbi:MAG: protein PelE [Pseudomonadota bacterium]|nr:protein PelE [Pseudomonadota bacterium]
MVRLPMLLGFAAEVLAGALLWLSESWMVLTAVMLHAISSYYFAQGFWQLLPRRYKLPARRSLTLLFIFLWMLPVLGALGLLWSVIGALKRPRSRPSQTVKIITLPELPFSPPIIVPVPPYSQGALRQIVHFAERPLKRLKAVMATRHMPSREAMMVWSKATRDPVDDVRLLAYAMKDDSEKKLTEQILALTEALSGVPVRMQNGYHKTIAALCWELVYHRLAQGAVRQHWLQTAQHHMELVLASSAAESAESAIPTVPDANSWLLYGRILLDSGDLEPARKAFAKAQAGGIDEQKILPWLAEIAFSERKFSEVKRYMTALRRHGEKGRELAQVKAWWSNE